MASWYLQKHVFILGQLILYMWTYHEALLAVNNKKYVWHLCRFCERTVGLVTEELDGSVFYFCKRLSSRYSRTALLPTQLRSGIFLRN